MKNKKDINQILNQLYVSAEDLMELLPIGLITARRYINEAQEEMNKKNYFIPEGKTKVALTKIIRKKFGI